MFYCPRCRIRFSAEAATSALVCPRCHTEDAVFAPFTSWAFDLGERTEPEERHSGEGRRRRSKERRSYSPATRGEEQGP